MSGVVSIYIVAILASWIIAQGTKYIIAAIKNKSLRVFRNLYLSGNMPSAHSASVVSLAMLIGLTNGFDSAIFALSMLFAAIVMYDAIMVRRSVGEQGIAIAEMIKVAKNGVIVPRAAKGHTPLEVLVGGCLGVVIGIVVFLATK